MTTIPMAAWCVRLIAELEVNDGRAARLVQGLTIDQLNWKPSPDSWSVGQCLAHLVLANEVYLPPIAAALNGAGEGLRRPVQYVDRGWFSRWFMRNYIEPQRELAKPRRVPAPKKIVPGARVELSVLDSFLAGNRAVRELVVRAGAYNVNRIRFENPFVSWIRFTVGTGLEIVGRHQVRHLMQAERVRAGFLTG